MIKSEIVRVTPEQAREWLENAGLNRKVRLHAVELYANEMRNRDWRVTNQGIGFDVKGVLIDGQHRLRAIMAADRAVDMLVVTGLPECARDLVDSGIKRTVGDQLRLAHGVQNASTVAAVCGALVYVSTGARVRMSVSQTMRVLELYRPEIDQVLSLQDTTIKGGATAPILGCFVFALKSHPDPILDFVKRYKSGVELNEGSPVLAFRNLVIHGYAAHPSVPDGSDYRARIVEFATHALMFHVQRKPLPKAKRSTVGLAFFRSASAEQVRLIRAVFHLDGGTQQDAA